ncbi:MAG: elongation factor G, partial [Pseudomonadota bacterium]|nr:elongation factor G [Pseudomonadota bacterium]
ALLKQSGAIAAMGSIERGNTVCDFDPMEKAHQHSLKSSIASMDHDSIHVNLIDTPGLPDFIGQSISVFPAVETVAVVINAQLGIEMVTRRMLEWAQERKLCRMIVINKIDAPGVDLPDLVEEIRSQFGAECLPINLPAADAGKVIDCFFKPAGEADFSDVDDAHTRIVDQVVEVDEELMELYLEQSEDLSPEQLHEPFEKALREGHLVPICFASAMTGAGVPELVQVIEHLMPNPLEGNPRPFLKGEGEDAETYYPEPDPAKHVVAHVFKVTADPFVGKLSVFRVHQGTVTPASQLYVGDGRKPFKVGHILKLQGKEQSEISKAIPGDICAVAKVEEIHFDSVLHDSHEDDYLHLKPLDFPVPVYGLAFTPATRGEEQRLNTAMQRVVEEDPCLKIEHDASLNETVLRGLGDLHLRFAFEGLQQRFGVEAETRPPRVAYRETIAKPAEGHHRHKKQTGGAGQFAEVYLRIRPRERGAGYQFVNKVHGGTIPTQFIPAVEKGVQQAMESGAVAGYKMQDVEVEVYDGKHHPVDSKEIAFVAAGKKAFLDAVTKAKPLVLEPIVSLDVVVPSDYMGGVTGEISTKRGHLLGTEALANGELHIMAQAPLSELTRFEAEMKSITGGHGTYTLAFSHYQPVPPPLQKQLADQHQNGGEEN